jgi:hypothetical protein
MARLLPIYRRDGWVLARCTMRGCGRVNYVEPHGVHARCVCSKEETEHESIPYENRVESLRGPFTSSRRVF